MRLTTFVALMALYGALAFCCVQETSRQTRLKYRLAQALRQEDEARRRLDDLRAEEMRLLQTTRLMGLNEDPALRLRPLRPWPGETRRVALDGQPEF